MSEAMLHSLGEQGKFTAGQTLFEDGTELAGLFVPVEPLFKPFLGEGDASGNARTSGLGADVATDRDRMLVEHLPTVRYIARRIHERLPQHVELDDLVSAGVVGLIDAFAKFDHTKKVLFKSYAQFRIRGAILDS